jgi:phosphatidylserine decarboxylase
VVTVLPPRQIALEKAAELGRFNMGSTVIVLFQAHRARWLSGVSAGTTVRLGQSLGTLE